MTEDDAAYQLKCARFDTHQWAGRIKRNRLRFGDSVSAHSGLSWRRLAFRQPVIRSASGINSLHNRITSGVQRSAASEVCAEAGIVSAISSMARIRSAEVSNAKVFIVIYPIECGSLERKIVIARGLGNAKLKPLPLHRPPPQPNSVTGTPLRIPYGNGSAQLQSAAGQGSEFICQFSPVGER